ncbi:MAG: hypothetical protein EOM59_00905 [Clostridia bacterium]|nr:hypothetical protein [Clostridia bacterium]
MNESKNLKFYAILRDSYNGANFNEFCELLASDAVYESQWVIEPIIGKSNIESHLANKAKHWVKENNILHARIGTIGKQGRSAGVMILTEEGIPCLVVDQGENRIIVLLKESEERLIARIDICMPQFFNVYPQIIAK